jgi:hypothetical protein
MGGIQLGRVGVGGSRRLRLRRMCRLGNGGGVWRRHRLLFGDGPFRKTSVVGMRWMMMMRGLSCFERVGQALVGEVLSTSFLADLWTISLWGVSWAMMGLSPVGL